MSQPRFRLKISSGYGYEGQPCELYEIRTLGTALTTIGDTLFAAGANAANMAMIVSPFVIEVTVSNPDGTFTGVTR